MSASEQFRRQRSLTMTLESRALQIVVTLSEELHFDRAAAKLYVSQPSLSAYVKKLECDLGLEFFNEPAGTFS
jgi:DNA-binding transcriptional LysR family regulator